MSNPASPKKGQISDGARKEIEELRRHNADLRNELKQFNAQLEQIQAQHEKALTRATARQKKRDKTDGSLLGTPGAKEGEAAALTQELAAANQKISFLTKANSDQKKVIAQSDPARLRQLASTISVLEDKLHNLKIENSTLSNEVKRMRTAHYALQTDEDKKELAYKDKQIRDSQLKCAELKKALEDEQRASRKQQDALVEANNKVQNLSNKAEVKGRTHAEVELREEVKSLRAQLNDLNQAREMDRMAQSQIVRQNGRKLQILEMTCKGLRQQLADAGIQEKKVEITTRKEHREPHTTKTQQLRSQAINKNKARSPGVLPSVSTPKRGQA